MNLNQFTTRQKEALLDLILLAMYADSHLAGIEEERVLGLLATMGFDSEYERSRQYDAAVTRIRRQAGTADSAAAYVTKLVTAFETPEQGRVVEEVLDSMVVVDRHVTLRETDLLSQVRQTLRKSG
jgi:hypothetical protein